MPGPALAVPGRCRPWWRHAAAGPALVVLVAGVALMGCGSGAAPGDAADPAGTPGVGDTGAPAALAAAVVASLLATASPDAPVSTGRASAELGWADPSSPRAPEPAVRHTPGAPHTRC
ncbi:MAG: hypothetical protein OEW29_03735, partial [Acidimicrobiia bacterium]|nr:hypothetical protein [Acidimicrobiia bacterium]